MNGCESMRVFVKNLTFKIKIFFRDLHQYMVLTKVISMLLASPAKYFILMAKIGRKSNLQLICLLKE